MKHFISLLIFLCFFQMSFAQLGNNCGIPTWSDTVGYQSKSVVKYNSEVYANAFWSQGDIPNGGSIWTLLGNCNEQLLINNPALAYTGCENVSPWNATINNYKEGDIVRYKYGVYKVKYYILGSVQPDTSEAYDFLGICVIPIKIRPKFQDRKVVIQKSAFQSLTIEAEIETGGFTAIDNKIRIKKTDEIDYKEYRFYLANDPYPC